VLAATLNSLVEPVKPIAFASVMPALVFNSATLLDALLSKLIAPFVLVKLDSEVRSSMAVLAADGVINILLPPTGPNAPATVAANVPFVMVVVPV